MKSRALLGAVFAVAALPVQLQAQDEEAAGSQVGEIIVTAQHREENLQQVPISVSTLSADALAEGGVSGTSAITQAVPAVQFTRSGPVGMFFVRGVGTSNGAAGDEGSNAFYVDGVYMPDQFQNIVNFNNIERIEVLKGPQGTLFGRNAYGGLVHMITRDPSEGLAMNAKAGYGKYETTNGQFYAGGPVSDTLALDIALTGQHQGKGWGDNFTRREETKQEKYWGARSKAVYTPSDELKFTLSGDAYELKDNTALAWRIADGFVGAGGNLSPGGQDTTANDPALTSLRTWGTSLTIEADLGFATLTSITAARQNDQHSFFDTDAGPLSLIRMDYNSGTRSLQQELRLASNETEPLSWQAGMFWLRSRIYADALIQGMGFWNPVRFPGGAGNLNAGQHLPAELDTDTWAAFGEATYTFAEKTHLTLGYRYTEDTRSFDAAQEWVVVTLPTTPVSDTLRYDEGTYRVALRHDLTDDVNVYASWNRGFKAGTYNMQAPLSPAVQPMSIDAYEVGVKSELFDRRVRLNVALFHYDMDDYQVRVASGATGSSFLLNAAKAETDGIDVEFEWAAMDDLSVYGGITMLDAEYDSFPSAPFNYPHSVASLPAGATCPPTTVFPTPPTGGLLTCSGNAAGNETAMSPDFTGTIGATYTIPLANSREVRLSALYNYNSGYYFEPDLTTGQSSYHVFNASVEYVFDDNWSVALWGKNLTDDEYSAQISSTGTGPFETLAPPRTYGVSVSYNY